MHAVNHRSRRKTEVVTGFIMLLTTFCFIAAILVDFNFISPYTTLYEDLSFLIDHRNNQVISSYAWFIVASLIFISIPLYIFTFNGRLKALHYVASLFILAASAGLFLTGWLGLEFSNSIKEVITTSIQNIEENNKLRLLSDFRDIQYYKRLVSSSLAVFVILLGLTKFRVKLFPVLSSILFITAGPVLIFFNWYDTEHILMTSAIAVIATGMIVLCLKLIYSGLSPRNGKERINPH